MSGNQPHRSGAVAVAVVGVIVPDEPRFHGPAFNRAGQMFQDELLGAVQRAGLEIDRVLSFEPVPTFPRAMRLLGRTGLVRIRSGLAVEMLPFLNLPGFKVATVSLSTFWAILRWAWQRRGRRRVIHMFNLTMPPALVVWAAARLSRSFLTVSVLDVWKPGGLVPDTWARRIDFWLVRLLLPRFDAHMVVSPTIARDLVPGRRVCVVEGGIAPDRFPIIEHGEGRRRSGIFRLVLSGSLEAYNGVRLVLDAMDQLGDDVELVVAGTGALEMEIAARARTDARVTFVGLLPFEDVLALYVTADLLLNVRLTKLIDTRYFFPSKLMELLASGTPVLSTCTGQVESDYGHVLYLLREETPAALARRISEIRDLSPQSRKACGDRAREFMFTSKTWARQGERLASYIRQEVLGAEYK